jgi:hypothetical protein
LETLLKKFSAVGVNQFRMSILRAVATASAC